MPYPGYGVTLHHVQKPYFEVFVAIYLKPDDDRDAKSRSLRYELVATKGIAPLGVFCSHEKDGELVRLRTYLHMEPNFDRDVVGALLLSTAGRFYDKQVATELGAT